MPNPGDIVDRYAIEAPLGSGGMADVFRVRHTATDGLHALKVLRSGNPKVRDRLMQEARVQAALRHPNVVAVTDVIDVEGSPGLIMEYVDGPSLVEWLEHDRPPLSERLELFRAVLRGVRAAHDLGVVHRDLSPHNILVQRTADGPHPKVTDFGIAKVLDPERAAAHKTWAGHPMGTPAFMAPEQVRDASDVDQRADIWALGSLLYLMVSDRLAFEGEDILQIFNKIDRAEYPEPPAGLPPGVVAAIRGCLTVDREKRLQRCEDLAALLAEPRPGVVAPRPAPSPAAPSPAVSSPAVSSPSAKGSGPSSAALAAIGAGVLVAGGGLWWVLRQGEQAPMAVEGQTPIEQVQVADPGEAPPPSSPAPSAGSTAPAPDPAAPPPVVPHSTPSPGPGTAKPDAAGPDAAGPGPTSPAPADPTPAAALQDAASDAAAAATGTWTLAGDLDGVQLEAARGKSRFPPGPVPAGTYRVLVDGTSQAQVVVAAGATVTVSCTRANYVVTCSSESR